MRGPRFLAVALSASAVLLAWGCTRAAADDAGPRPGAAADLDAAARAHPVTFLDRLGWGADNAQLAELQRVGATRLLDRQLQASGPGSGSTAPDVPEPIARSLADLAAQVPSGDALGAWFAEQRRMRKDARQLGGDKAQAKLRTLQQQDAAITRAAMQQQLLLDVYARDQLRQRLTWFWMNHFNVFRGGLLGPMMGDYVQRVIAPHALGSFRELLRATMFSPQMVIYLNNARNARGHINENYAREVMELHTLGVGGGYTQADVTHLAHVLTGLGIDAGERPFGMRGGFHGRVWRDGMVVFRPARHDPEPQVVLGRELQGRSVDEIDQVVTLLADDPATARHLSFELAQYLVGDHPDPAMVDAMVRTWRSSDGDIAAVLRTMFTSRGFIASLAQPQFKDPMRYVISAVRCSAEGRVIRNPQPLLGMLGRLGEPLYGRSTPDGYPIDGGAWDSPGQLTTRFEIAQQLGAGSTVLFEPPSAVAAARGMAPPQAMRPREPARVPRLSSGAVYLAAAPLLRPATVAALAKAGRPAHWNALWLASPDFMND